MDQVRMERRRGGAGLKGMRKGTTTFFLVQLSGAFVSSIIPSFHPLKVKTNSTACSLYRRCVLCKLSLPLRGGAANRKATGEASGGMTQPEKLHRLILTHGRGEKRGE